MAWVVVVVVVAAAVDVAAAAVDVVAGGKRRLLPDAPFCVPLRPRSFGVRVFRRASFLAAWGEGRLRGGRRGEERGG